MSREYINAKCANPSLLYRHNESRSTGRAIPTLLTGKCNYCTTPMVIPSSTRKKNKRLPPRQTACALAAGDFLHRWNSQKSVWCRDTSSGYRNY